MYDLTLFIVGKVVDASKLHESTFNGCEKVYKALPLNKIERQRHNKVFALLISR